MAVSRCVAAAVRLRADCVLKERGAVTAQGDASKTGSAAHHGASQDPGQDEKGGESWREPCPPPLRSLSGTARATVRSRGGEFGNREGQEGGGKLALQFVWDFDFSC